VYGRPTDLFSHPVLETSQDLDELPSDDEFTYRCPAYQLSPTCIFGLLTFR
jgi:hypothetical protein